MLKKTLLAFLVLFGVSSPVWAWNSTTILNNGSSANRVNIVFVGDGYTSGELGKYAADVQKVIDELFLEPPFDTYKNLFNVYRVDVVSNQSGSDHPLQGTYVDTALDSSYSYQGNPERCVYADVTKVLTAAGSAPAAATPGMILTIVNDAQYGGCGGAISVFSTHQYSALIAIHELGHSFVILADEYDYPNGTYSGAEPSRANETIQTARSNIKWNHWIDGLTSIPTTTTANNVPGLYEGSSTYLYGVYRPTYQSIMRVLGGDFEDINTEQVVLKTYTWVSPLDGYSPSAVTINLSAGGSQIFNVTPVAPIGYSLNVEWFLNGTSFSSGNQLTITDGDLNLVSNTLQAVLSDPTSFVRSDPSGLLTETQTWTITKDNFAPTVADNGAQAVDEGSLLQFVVTAADVNGDGLILDAALADGSPLSSIGAGFVDNMNNTGTFNWTPDFTQGTQIYNVRFSALDSLGATGFQDIAITVNDRPEILAQITSPVDGARFVLDTTPVTVTGSVLGSTFASYQLFYTNANSSVSWVSVEDSVLFEVDDSVLGYWDLSSVADGNATLKLAVTGSSGTIEDTKDVVINRIVKASGIGSIPSSVDIFDNKIVWQEDMTGNADVYMYDVLSSTLVPISTHLAQQMYPSIDQNRIVWADDRDGTDQEIYLYDLTSSTEQRLTFDASQKFQIDISGDVVVWSDYRNGKYEIFMFDIVTGIQTQLTNDALVQSSPQVDGNWIVYSDGNQIYLYEISTATTQAIGLDVPGIHFNPTLSGDRVVFSVLDGGNRSTYYYVISSGQSFMIPNVLDGLVSQRVPVDGDNIFWNDLNVLSQDVFMRNLSTGVDTQLTFNFDEQQLPIAQNNIVAWLEYENGNGNTSVYYKDIGLQASMPYEAHWLEAEYWDTKAGNFSSNSDGLASNGEYVSMPNGSGTRWSPTTSHMMTYNVNIAEAGDYVLWGRAVAATMDDDSFYVQVDGGVDNLWDVTGDSSWGWDVVSNRRGANPVVFNFSVGAHTIKVKGREDGTQLDKLLLTNDLSYVPSGLGDAAENIPVPQVAITLGATPLSIVPGDSSTLNWTVTNATSCTASNGWSGAKGLSGTEVVSPSTTSTYVLDCTGAGGTATSSVTVNVVIPGSGESHWLEAEYWDTKAGKFKSSSDGIASNGEYVSMPNGSGMLWSPTTSHMVTYNVNVATAGDYILFGRILAANGYDNSFYIQIDNGTDNLWDTDFSGSWLWNKASHRGGADPVVFNLSVGAHTIKVKGREDGTQLDKLLLTNDLSYVPSGLGDVAENIPVPQVAITLGATPLSIAPGDSSMLNWTVTNATSCTASNGWSGAKGLSGTEVVSPSTTSTYVLDCTGAGGTETSSVTVNVVIPGSGESHWLEAEYWDTKAGKFKSSSDGLSSNGEYVSMPNGSGTRWSPTTSHMVTYDVNIAEAGDYVLWGRAVAATMDDDSFYVQVDGGVDNLWDVTGDSSWGWDVVSNRGGANPVVFNLSAGVHTIKVKGREDGTQLDKLLLTNDFSYVPSGLGDAAENIPVPQVSISFGATALSIAPGESSTLSWIVTNATSCTASNGWSGTKGLSGSEIVSPATTSTYALDCTGAGGTANDSVTVNVVIPGSGEFYWLEAEASDTQAGNLVVGFDGLASSGQFISMPNGSGSWWSPTSSHMVTYNVNVATAGDYILFGRILAANGYDNSFYIQIDNGTDNLWDTDFSGSWLWNKASHRGGADPVVFNLSVGAHTIKVKGREDGTQLDKLLLTNDLSYVPSGFGD